jgi:hypothetical protein
MADTDTDGAGGEQLSALKRLVFGCLQLNRQDDPAHILELVAAAAESLVPCQTVGVLLDQHWQDVGQRGRGVDPADVKIADGSVEGKLVTVPGVPWAWAFRIPASQGGCLVVGITAELADRDRDVLQALAQHAGAALASAGLHDHERAEAAELRAANLALRNSMEIHDRLTQVAMRGEGHEGIARAVYALTGHAAEVKDSYGNLMARSGPGHAEQRPQGEPERQGELPPSTSHLRPLSSVNCLIRPMY